MKTTTFDPTTPLHVALAAFSDIWPGLTMLTSHQTALQVENAPSRTFDVDAQVNGPESVGTYPRVESLTTVETLDEAVARFAAAPHGPAHVNPV